MTWLDNNPNANEEQIVNRKREMETACRPVAMRLYASTGASVPQQQTDRQFPRPSRDESGSGGRGGPVIDEVD